MPIYEYKCNKCGLILEEIQKITDKPLVKCPECNKKSLQKQISTPNFVLKGQGFYGSHSGSMENSYDDY